jgi:PPOX class probable F420-dependent enzyme
MPALPIPARFDDLLAAPVMGHLATVSADGAPQVNPVWFIRDGDLLLLSVKESTAKYRNMLANPRAALSVIDPADSHRYIELRGEVVALDLYLTLEWVDELARKYTGRAFTGGRAGERRYKVTIRVEKWTGQS